VDLPAWSVLAALAALTACVIGWNLGHGARLAVLPSAPRAFRMLSGLSVFLLLPALAIGVLAPTASGARVLGALAWLWPLVALGIAVQALWALVSRRAGIATALLISLFDLLVGWIAVMHWLASRGTMLPDWMLIPGLSVSSLAATALGDRAFPWGAALLVPVLAPGAPARTRLGAVARAVAGTVCATGLIGVAGGAAVAASTLNAFAALGSATPLAGERSDFAIGVRVFGHVSGTPSGVTARRDMTLADSLGVTAVHVEFTPDGATVAALDSVSRSLDPRRDSITIIVTLDIDDGARLDDAVVAARIGALERITRHVNPDVLVPADHIVGGDATRWKAYYLRATSAVRRLDRNVTVALGTDAGTGADSALVDWVFNGQTAVDAVGLAVRNHADQPARALGALAAISRWAARAARTPTVWLLGAPTAPAVTGEAAQAQMVRYILAWSEMRPWVRGVIAGDASDEVAATGLRTANGRSRQAVVELGAALRASHDIPAPIPTAPAATALRAPDSLPPTR
jgi:hypothetical protein